MGIEELQSAKERNTAMTEDARISFIYRPPRGVQSCILLGYASLHAS